MDAFLQSITTAWKTLKEIFRLPQYFLLALTLALLVFVFSVWFPNLGLISDIVFLGSQTLQQKTLFLWYSLGAVSTNFSFFSASLTILIALLFGLNIAVSVYYFKKRLAFQKTSGISIVGMFAGIIGVGCASCGSVVLATFIGVGATATVTSFLPFKGQEFTLLSVILLLGTLYYTAKKSADPLACKIEPRLN